MAITMAELMLRVRLQTDQRSRDVYFKREDRNQAHAEYPIRYMPGEHPVEVLDLPHISTKPSYDELISAIDKLRVKPESWTSRVSSAPITRAYQKGIGGYLADIIKSDLKWLDDDNQRDDVMDKACTVMSDRCGPTARGPTTRTFNLPATDVSPQLEIKIFEPPLTGDNLGLKTWASAYLLARRLPTLATKHNLFALMQEPAASKGVLELGAGTGLVGIAAAAILHCRVLLTDLEPIVGNILNNIAKNLQTVNSHGGRLAVSELDWVLFERSAACRPEILSRPGFQPPSPPNYYQCVVAADPLYDPEHAFLVARTVHHTLALNKEARFILELPLRDDATKAMRDELKEELESYGLELLESGTEDGYDDWEDMYGEAAVVHCWWGVWGRKS